VEPPAVTAQTEAEAQAAAKLHRVLGVWNLALLAVAAIVSLRLMPNAVADSGPAALGLWVLGLVTFFVPSGLAVLELSSRHPGEGGLYLWARAAFGDMHGFLAGWIYVTSNLTYYPSLLLSGAGALLFIGGAEWTRLAGDPAYNIAFCVAAMVFATWLNIIGLQRARWLTDLAGHATWAVAALLVTAGIVAWTTAGSATEIAPRNVIPDLTEWANFTAFSGIALAYIGLELGPIMGGEIRDPKRTIRRSVVLAGLMVAFIYIAGTAALLVALPADAVDRINGIPQALAVMGKTLGVPGLGAIAAILFALGAVGGMSAWLGGTSRLPFVFGIDRFLPPALGKVHPTYGSPHVSLLAQGIVATVVLVIAAAGETMEVAYSLLLNMAIMMGLAPILYIFAALPVLRWKARGKNDGVWLVPGGLFGCVVVGAVGFVVTLAGIVIAMIPPEGANPVWFFVKAVGGSILIVGVGLIFFLRGRRELAATSAVGS
jgi:amino acid transporter